ncbi:MAG: PLP-dependent aminotransferase family protein [Candidatus Cloacimonetes bacterium]|nr:PLP-dependent aminotransferase family protein [Candidatus Cloacimonadota bacterium]
MQNRERECQIHKHFSRMTARMKSSMIRELVASTKGIPGLISLAGGFPSPLTFPVAKLAELYREVILTDGADILQYGSSEGDAKLKHEIKQLENLPDLPDDQLLITCGATNGIFLFAKTFIDEGDIILTEAPSFLGSLVAFEGTGAELVGVEMDEDGMRIEALEAAIATAKASGKTIKFCYVIPDFQNPTGITTSLERRRQILAVAARHSFFVLEDDPYGALRYDGESLPPMFQIAREEMGRDDLVTLVKSFSKVLGPGLRLAYVIGTENLIAKLSSWLQKVNVSVDCITQRVIGRFIAEGLLPGQIEHIKSIYRPRLHAMLNTLEQHMPSGVTWTHPQGGMFVWLNLPAGIDADALFEIARAHKVAFLPGSKFFPPGCEQPNSLRLNFSYPTVEQIEVGVERLAILIGHELNA